eukprot:1157317-Pelagomonas_calceolata.AAC.11
MPCGERAAAGGVKGCRAWDWALLPAHHPMPSVSVNFLNHAQPRTLKINVYSTIAQSPRRAKNNMFAR